MKHLTNLTVRSYECDSYGHVNHAVYVFWCVVDRNGRPARPPEAYDLRRLMP